MNSQVVWDNFSRVVGGCWERALNSKQYQDVTLMSEDCQEFGAHRMILSSSSEKFERIFQLRSEDKHPVIFLRGLTAKQVSALLLFIYQGKVEVPSEDLETFLRLVSEFKIDTVEDSPCVREESVGGEDDPMEVKCEVLPTDILKTEESIEDSTEHKHRAEEEENVTEVLEETITDKVEPASIEQKLPSPEKLLQFSYFENSDFRESSQRQEDGLHHCMKCTYKTKRKELLRAHMSSTHDGPKILCPYQGCGRAYSNKANLKAHLRSCHNCDKCDQTFDSNIDIKRHKRLVHNSLF